MATATVPEAKAYLLAALRAAPGLANVQVEWSHPGKGIKLETIYFGDTNPYQQKSAALGARYRTEEYELELVVTIEKAGNDPEATERRCWALVAAVEDVLRSEPDLGGTVRVAEFTASPVKNYVGPQKRVAESVIAVSVTSEI